MSVKDFVLLVQTPALIMKN